MGERKPGMEKPEDGRKRVVIENLEPELNCGRFPIKRIAGETVEVEADVFADGHEEVRAWLLWKREGEERWKILPMASLGNDRWRGEFSVERMGRYFYTVSGEIDRFGTWRHDLEKRIAAGQDLRMPFQAGAILLEQAAASLQTLQSIGGIGGIEAEDAAKLSNWARQLKVHNSKQKLPVKLAAKAAAVALDSELAETVKRHRGLAPETRYARELEVVVDREKAGFSAWYELFPRSWSGTPGKPGTLRDVARRLEYVAEMGFDVLYLAPIYPIGTSFRKGKNNATEAGPEDVGSPWAIGSRAGGFTAIDPELGTMEDFEMLRERARALGMEIALDIAFQTSPDHPWVAGHPEFFKKQPDGSIQYAENPPKKYQDIYPLNFESSNWQELWDELKSVLSFWIDHGVRIFRVDNPHTKPFPFWEWVIAELKAEDPGVLFLAEAFTRPRLMDRLAKLGFSQSYTYFAWRNSKEELISYMHELSRMRDYLRPNFWPNTPDILTATLQTGGLPAFKSRLVLAGTLAANYGIYGPAFELGVNLPVQPGSEEYLNSEKYEIKSWDLKAPGSLKPLIAKLNRARRENKALQSDRRLHFHAIDNPQLLCYSKRTPDGGNTVLVVVNLDPFYTQSGWVDLDLDILGLDPAEAFEVEDLLADRRYLWRGSRNYVELRPQEIPAHLFRVRKGARAE